MGEWKVGTFGCFSDCTLCIITYLVPCYTFGKTAEKVGESCCMCGFCLLVPIGNIVAALKIRGKVREAKGIDGSCINDFVCMWLCGFCTLVQMAIEVKDDSPPAADGQAMARD